MGTSSRSRAGQRARKTQHKNGTTRGRKPAPQNYGTFSNILPQLPPTDEESDRDEPTNEKGNGEGPGHQQPTGEQPQVETTHWVIVNQEPELDPPLEYVVDEKAVEEASKSFFPWFMLIFGLACAVLAILTCLVLFVFYLIGLAVYWLFHFVTSFDEMEDNNLAVVLVLVLVSILILLAIYWARKSIQSFTQTMRGAMDAVRA